jgi:hypothetical protein
LVETVSFSGTQLSPPGSSNTANWTADSGPAAAASAVANTNNTSNTNSSVNTNNTSGSQIAPGQPTTAPTTP